MKNHSRLFRSTLPALTLLIGVPATFTPLPAQEVDAAVADAKAAAIKAMLQHLDDQIDRMDEFIESAPTAQDRASAKVRLEGLKERRTELRKNYAQARYDSLKADVQTEYNKLSQWAKKTFSGNPEAALDRKVDAATAAKIKASLATLDTELEVLETRCDRLPKGPAHDAAQVRLKAFQSRRAALAANFDRARYEDLLEDVKAQAKKLAN